MCSKLKHKKPTSMFDSLNEDSYTYIKHILDVTYCDCVLVSILVHDFGGDRSYLLIKRTSLLGLASSVNILYENQ